MCSDYKKSEYAQNSKKLLSEDIRVVGKKIYITANELDKELELDLDLLENIIKESKANSA